jgi:hypothetical protein
VDYERNPYNEDILNIVVKRLKNQKPDLLRVHIRLNTDSTEPTKHYIVKLIQRIS